ncbi:MAG TPA: hypothetical protein VJ850_03230 [Candidatus Limnocylindrales bacterium]|nr:hypothetical protein [Candidatus Limnocylindrales bacterium]
MEPGSRTLDDPLAEALRIVEVADREGLLLRLMGGMAVRAHAPDWTHRTRRVEVDLDFATRAKDRKAVFALLEREGYTPDKRHNALFGQHQGYFVDEAHRRPVDVLVDKLEMCHRIEFADRLGASRPTLPVADLLLSKLQIVKINRKDVLDALVLLAEHPLAQDDGAPDSHAGQGAISLPRILAHTSNDWGWWRTVTGNLTVLQEFLDTDFTDADMDVGARPVRFDVRAQLAALRDAIENAPKSTRWKLRSKIGDRQQWYVEPEEVGHN